MLTSLWFTPKYLWLLHSFRGLGTDHNKDHGCGEKKKTKEIHGKEVD